jgi:hypothetical protein
MDRIADQQAYQIQRLTTSWPCSPARKLEAITSILDAGECPASAAAGEQPAHHPHTGPGAEGSGGWPMHATAQPSHAEERPSLTGRTAETAGDSTMVTSARPSLEPSGFNFQISLLPHGLCKGMPWSKGLLGMRKENALHRTDHAPVPYLRRLQPAPSHSKGEGQNPLTDLLTSKPEGV